MSAKSTMRTTDGIAPYPKISGAKTGNHKPWDVVLSPQTGTNSMSVCTVCGMGSKENPAHGSDYIGPGKHSFNSANKSIDLSEDSPVFFGGELKALGDGRLGGWAILFSDHESPDLTNDYFDKSTDFFFEGEQKAIRPILYDHGLDPTLKSRKIGRGTLEIKDAGVWFETEKALADAYDSKYIPYIQDMAEKGMLGLSTGSAPHLIQREQVGKAFHMKSWPIVEISLTPKPIEPRTKKAMALKSYAEDRVDLFKGVVDGEEEDENDTEHDFVPSKKNSLVCDECGGGYKDQAHGDKKSIDRPLKSLFEEKLAQRTQSVYELDRARDEVFRDIIAADKVSDITGAPIDKRTKVTETVTEYAARLISLVLEQMQKFLDGEYDNSMSSPVGGQTQFYLRSFQESPLQSFLSIKSALETEANLDEHSFGVVTALSEFATLSASINEAVKAFEDRCKEKIEFRTGLKSGRTISAATLGKLSEMHDAHGSAIANMTETHNRIGELMKLATPKKTLSIGEQLQIQLGIAAAEHENVMADITSH